MKVRLDVISGPQAGQTYSFDGADSFVVGRSPKVHLVLDPRADRFISRTHFLLDIRPPRIIINDLESTNGTFVNETRVSRFELSDGDEIRVGRTRIKVRVLDGGIGEQPLVPAQPPARQVTEPARAVAAAQVTQRSTVELDQACLVCKRDLSRWANADGMAQEYADSRYICPTCTARHTAEGLQVTQVADYRFIAEIGRGGMGVVYRAVHQPTRRIFAVKLILPEVARDERSLLMFQREVGIQSAVIHRNLVRIYEQGQEEGSCFLTAEYLAGGDLEKLVTSVFKGTVAPKLACRLIIDVLGGLQALHDHGFVHRDLKPPNLVLSHDYRDPRAVAKVTDYGLAKSFEEAGNSLFDYTRAGEAGGSLMFMPPEQILDYRYVRPPTDVYAAGVSLYYLLSASYTVDFPTTSQAISLAVKGGKRRNPIEIILEEAPVPILQRKPTLPPNLARVVDRAVQKELTSRFQTAAEFEKQLRDAGAKDGLL